MNDIYEALNHVDIDLNKYEDKPLNDIEFKKIKKRINGKLKNKGGIVAKWTKRVAIIVGTLTLSLAVTYKANPTFAINLPLVGNLIKSIVGQGNEEYDKYTQVINKTIEKNGIRVTLNEFNIDSIGARIATTFEGDEILERKQAYADLNLYINGEYVSRRNGGVHEVVDGKYVAVDILKEFKSYEHAPEQMEVRLVYEEIEIGDKLVKGPWEFKFNIYKKDIMTEAEVYKVDKNFKLKDGSDVWLERITITPLAMRLDLKSNSKSLQLIDANVKDNNDNIMKKCGGSKIVQDEESIIEIHLSGPKKEAKKLSFKLLAIKDAQSYEELGEYEFELELK